MTGFADNWDRELLGDLVGTWVTRGYMTGNLMDVEPAGQHGRPHHRLRPRRCRMRSVSVAPRHVQPA